MYKPNRYDGIKVTRVSAEGSKTTDINMGSIDVFGGVLILFISRLLLLLVLIIRVTLMTESLVYLQQHSVVVV